MRVQWAVLARYAEVNGGLVTMVGGGIDLFGVPAFPGTVDFHVVANFRFHEAEAGADREIRLEILDSELRPVGAPAVFTVSLGLSEGHLAGWEAGISLVVPCLLDIPAPGTHSVTLSIDDDARAVSLPFMVVEGEV